MAVDLLKLQALNSVTKKKWNEVNPINYQGKVGSQTLSKAEAEALSNEFSANLKPMIVPSNSEPGKYRVFLDYNALSQMMDSHQQYYNPNYSWLTRTEAANRLHGTGNVVFEGLQWQPVQTDVNFAENPVTRFVSLGQSLERERLFVNTESTLIGSLLYFIIEEARNKPVQEVLEIVNSKIDNLTTNHLKYKGLTREQIESQLDDKLDKYLELRKQGKVPNKPNNLDVTIDELVDEGVLVCRHKAILAAFMMGKLIELNILPLGSARQYRSELQNQEGETIGAHSWSVYRQAQTGEVWVNDPRWAQVVKVDPNNLAALRYGTPAAERMMSRLNKLDAAVLSVPTRPKPVIHAVALKDSPYPKLQVIKSKVMGLHLNQGLRPGENRHQLIEKFDHSLEAIMNNPQLSENDKDQLATQKLQEFYLSTLNAATAEGAKTIAKKVLKELKIPIPELVDILPKLKKIKEMVMGRFLLQAVRPGDESDKWIQKFNQELETTLYDKNLTEHEKDRIAAEKLEALYLSAKEDDKAVGAQAVAKQVLKELKMEIPKGPRLK